jgi:hypothetical protein
MLIASGAAARGTMLSCRSLSLSLSLSRSRSLLLRVCVSEGGGVPRSAFVCRRSRNAAEGRKGGSTPKLNEFRYWSYAARTRLLSNRPVFHPHPPPAAPTSPSSHRPSPAATPEATPTAIPAILLAMVRHGRQKRRAH